MTRDLFSKRLICGPGPRSAGVLDGMNQNAFTSGLVKAFEARNTGREYWYTLPH